ncbi:phage antirepressor KilAC domain-containing protein [Ruania suaedae]|uniref:phage antirepressor KilAC domain-containing protein n=1 Tax=Ruania suaedae TaxID=2897774 RepID=UPI001E618D4E|nr:phage antirepressor KilAC domain-containing protein [Ruania suaedae]UFU03472.1 phage antirepressor KilAC domain-containing protein [Ruania suaedae]
MIGLTQFNFHGEGVRVIVGEFDEPWFVAADVAAILSYRMASDLTRHLEPEEVGTRPVRTPSGMQSMTVITESGLYSAMVQRQTGRIADESVRDRVRAFRRWVTGEVLPSVRKTGSYGAPQLTGRELMAHALVEAQSVIEAAERRVKELEPSAHSWDTLVADTAGDWSMRDAAQILARDPQIQIGQNRLAKLLRKLRWIDARGIPYQAHVDSGRLMAKPQTRISHRTGERVTCDPQVRITLKGLAWLHQHLGGVAELETDTPTLAAVGS